MEIEALVRKQRDWFALGKTRSISFRIGALQTLKKEILGNRAELRRRWLRILANRHLRLTCVRLEWCFRSFIL